MKAGRSAVRKKADTCILKKMNRNYQKSEIENIRISTVF